MKTALRSCSSRIICALLFCRVSNWAGFIIPEEWFSLTILKAFFYVSSSEGVIPELAVSVISWKLVKSAQFWGPRLYWIRYDGGVTPCTLCLIVQSTDAQESKAVCTDHLKGTSQVLWVFLRGGGKSCLQMSLHTYFLDGSGRGWVRSRNLTFWDVLRG